MTSDEFKSLQPGDLVRHKSKTQTFIVTANFGNRVMAVAAVDLTNIDEWEVAAKALYMSTDFPDSWRQKPRD